MALKFIGRISAFKGYNGSLVVTDLPAGFSKVVRDSKVNIGFSEQFSRTYTVRMWQETEKGPLLHLKEITDEKQAEALKEQGIFAEEDTLRFKKDESYYIEQILECKAYDFNTGKEIGKIIDVWILPGNDVWVMESNGKQVPLPFIDEVIKKVDLENHRVEVELIDGLEDLWES